MLRRHRRRLPGWIVAVLLASQMLAAAYACPRFDAAPQEIAASAMAIAMPGCAGSSPMAMDPDQPQLCKAHCEAGSLSVNGNAGALDAPPAAAIGAALVGVLDVAAAETRAAAVPAGLAAGPPAGTPPLYLALLVLRN